jgi:hypothetical protein
MNIVWSMVDRWLYDDCTANNVIDYLVGTRAMHGAKLGW